MPDDVGWIIPVVGALSELGKAHNWESLGGGNSPESTAEVYAQLFDDWSMDDCMIGVMFPYISDTLPSNALACSGQTLLKSDYPKLYAKLDAAWIVDATHFKLPDCRARVILGSSAAAPSPLTPKAMGATGGEETHTLSQAEMPTHSHSYSAPSIPLPVAAVGTTPAVTTSVGSTTGNAGSSSAHNNMQPYIGLRWAIWAK